MTTADHHEEVLAEPLTDGVEVVGDPVDADEGLALVHEAAASRLVAPAVDPAHRLPQPIADGVDADQPEDPVTLVDDDAQLHARPEQGRERVAQGRLAAAPSGRPAWPPSGRSARSPSSSCTPIQPSGRSLFVDEKGVVELRDASRRRRTSARSSPACTMIGSMQLEVADAAEREALEPAIRPDEALDELGRRVGQDRGRRVVLGEDPAALEDRDPVAHLDRLVDVVGDEHDRLAHLLLEPEELVLEPLAADRVDRAERLVHQHDRRIGRQRASHADTLSLAARQLARVAIAVRAGLEADKVEELLDALARLRAPDQRSRPGTTATLSPMVRCGKRPTCWMT